MAGHGLEFRDLDLQNADVPELATLWFDMQNRFEPAEVRGEDLDIPQKEGMWEGTRVKRRLLPELRGFVRGIGDDVPTREASFRTASEALQAVMEHDLPSGTLRLFAPYLGLPAGSESIQARCVEATPGPIQSGMVYQRWVFRLLAIGDPLEWAEDESS